MYMVIICFTHPYSIRTCNGTYDLPDLHTSTITVTAECVQGILPADTVTMFGPSGQVLPFTISSKLYVFPSMNFSCDGTITDIRMRMQFKPGLPPGGRITQLPRRTELSNQKSLTHSAQPKQHATGVSQ